MLAIQEREMDKGLSSGFLLASASIIIIILLLLLLLLITTTTTTNASLSSRTIFQRQRMRSRMRTQAPRARLDPVSAVSPKCRARCHCIWTTAPLQRWQRWSLLNNNPTFATP